MSNKKRKRNKNTSARKPQVLQASENVKVLDKAKSEIPCVECEELLTDFMLGLLSEEDAKKTKQHLKVCPQCQSAQQELEQIVGILSHAEPVSPPPDFMKNLHRRLRKEQPIYLFVWNQIKYFCGKAWQIIRNYNIKLGAIVKRWWKSALLPVLKNVADHIGKMPKVWQIGAPVLACVFVAAVISTGIYTHMRSTVPGGMGNDQLAVSDNVNAKHKSNFDTGRGTEQEDTQLQQQTTESSSPPQGEKNINDMQQSVNPPEGNVELSDTAAEGNVSEPNTANGSAPDVPTSLPVQGNPQSERDTGGAVPTAETVSDDGDKLSAYSVGFDDEHPLLAESAPVPAAAGASGGAEARSAKAASQIPVGTMDVYTIKTSNLSQTLANSGFSGKAINENGKTVLILTKSQYNQLQKNLLSSEQTNNEEIKYTGAVALAHSYEWDGCFRVEITQR